MSELSKLLGQPEEVEIGGLKFKIKPLTLADLDLMGNMDPDNPDMGSLKKIIQKVLRDSFPDATDQEIDGVKFEHMKELTDAIGRVNKFKTEGSAEDKIKARINANKPTA